VGCFGSVILLASVHELEKVKGFIDKPIKTNIDLRPISEVAGIIIIGKIIG